MDWEEGDEGEGGDCRRENKEQENSRERENTLTEGELREKRKRKNESETDRKEMGLRSGTRDRINITSLLVLGYWGRTSHRIQEVIVSVTPQQLSNLWETEGSCGHCGIKV